MKMELFNCPFCKPLSEYEEVIIESANAIAIYDKYPATPGHALVIPNRHCENYFQLSTDEQRACWEIVNNLEKILMVKFKPDGFTIRININEAGGQEIPHVHIHLIPRYMGNKLLQK